MSCACAGRRKPLPVPTTPMTTLGNPIERFCALTDFEQIAKAIAIEAGVKTYEVLGTGFGFLPPTHRKELIRGRYAGEARPMQKHISVASRPDCDWNLLAWTHECGHVAHGHNEEDGKPRYVKEYEAGMWALVRLERWGVGVSDPCLILEKENVANYCSRSLRWDIAVWLQTPPCSSRTERIGRRISK